MPWCFADNLDKKVWSVSIGGHSDDQLGSHIQWRPFIARFIIVNILWSSILISLHIMLPFELTKDTPYLALSGELWSVFYEYFNRNWSCYKGFLLYVHDHHLKCGIIHMAWHDGAFLIELSWTPGLTLWGLYNMAAILHMVFSNAFFL